MRNTDFKMKILIVSQFNKDSKHGGGESFVTFSQAKALVEHGHDVAMLTHGDADRVFRDEETKILFIFAYTLGEAPFGYMPLTQAQFRFVEKSICDFKPDVIHSHTMNYLALMAQGVALRNQFKFLYTTHELPDKLVHFFKFAKVFQSLVSVFVNALVRAFLTNTDKVLAINNASKTSTLNLNFKNQIDIVHNGVSTGSYFDLEPVFSTKETKLYFSGGINSRKNQIYLVKMLEKLPSHYSLYLVGPQDAAYKAKIGILAQQLGISSRLILTGNINNHELPETVKNFHVFVSASLMEVQSVAVIEALAAAKPIVALDNETIEEFTNKKSVTRLAQDSTPEQFASAILALMKDQTTYLERAEEARELSKQYNQETAYQLNIQAYQTTVISESRDYQTYQISMFFYVFGVGLLFRVKQILSLFGFWKN